MRFKKNDRVIIVNTDNIWENKKGIILSDINDSEITNETEDYLVKIFFADDKTTIQEFNQNNLELDKTDEQLNEAKKEKNYLTDINKNYYIHDFIYPYVYISDLDDNMIHSWFFVDKIATAENITSKKVIEVAKKLKYKLFSISQNQFKKIIVASPKCAIETIYNEYADYLLGDAEVVELSDKGEK